ncbi:MAG: hypothetical protein ACK5PW_00335 [Burkholderiales bacterium]
MQRSHVHALERVVHGDSTGALEVIRSHLVHGPRDVLVHAPCAFARCEVGRRELTRTDIERSLAIWPHNANGAHIRAEKRAPSGAPAMGWRTSPAAWAAARCVRDRARARGLDLDAALTDASTGRLHAALDAYSTFGGRGDGVRPGRGGYTAIAQCVAAARVVRR